MYGAPERIIDGDRVVETSELLDLIAEHELLTSG